MSVVSCVVKILVRCIGRLAPAAFLKPLISLLLTFGSLGVFSDAAHAQITARVSIDAASYSAFAAQNKSPGQIMFFWSSIPNAGNNYGGVANSGNARLDIGSAKTNVSVNLGTTTGYFTTGFNNGDYAQATGCTTSPIDFYTSTGSLSNGATFDVTISCSLPDTTPPTPISAATNIPGTTLTITFNEDVSYSWPDTADFTVLANGATVSVTNVAYVGSTAVLTLSPLAYAGQTVTVSYNDANCDLMDTRGNCAISFSNMAVTNNSTASAVTPPTVATGAASGISSIGATLNGTASSNGASTTVSFQYGGTAAYGSSVAASQSPLASGASGASVWASVTGFDCNATYHYRVAAANSAGTANGGDQTFTTAACSSNAGLSGLALSSGTLSPAFATATTDYTASVANATTSITVAPTTADANATVTVNGTMVASGSASASIPLSIGNNTIAMVVTAQDGVSTVTYTVVVARAPTVPAAPSSVSTVAGNAQVTLNWTAPVDNGGSTVTGYNIRVSTSASGPWADAAGSCAPATANVSTALACTATGLGQGATYYFQVAALNSVGVGAYASEVSADTAAAATSTISASPNSIVADASTSSIITVQLKNASGTNLTGGGGSVTVTATNGALSGVTDNSDGTYTANLTSSTTAGTATVSGSIGSAAITSTAVVTFTAGAVSAGHSTMAASPATVTADGSAASTISVTLKDANGNPVSGKTVTLAQALTGGGTAHSVISTASGASSAAGVVSFSVTDTQAESVTYTATGDGIAITPTAVVTFTLVAPATPGTPHAVAGDREASVSWPQVFSGGGNPVSYRVTASPGGKSCTLPFPGEAFSSVSCTVTALTNGQSYTFTVTATNAVGSAISAPSATVTPQAIISGACGAADSVATLVEPKGFLCGGGIASMVTADQGDFSWTCTGVNGGTAVQCHAPGSPSTGPAAGSATFTGDAASGCAVQSAALIPSSGNGPNGGVTLPYGAVSFQMIDCQSGGAVSVHMTYAGIVEGLDFWKYVNNSYHNGWVQLPPDQVALVGNTATFVIVDNGEWDNDLAPGVIADPGGPGYTALPLTPSAVTNVKANPGDGSVWVSWAAPVGGGTAVRYTATANPGGQSCTVLAPATGCLITGLSNGVAYTFTVVAINAGGSGAASIPSGPVTPEPSQTPAPQPQPIPTIPEWGLILMSFLMLMLGWLGLQRWPQR